MFLIEREFENLVSKMPLVSIDICLLKNRTILLGKEKIVQQEIFILYLEVE